MKIPFIPANLVNGPFTVEQGQASGLSLTSLRSGPWRRILRGVWSHETLPDSREQRLAAVRLVLPERAVACGLTAAWLYGVDVRREDDFDVHVSFAKGTRVRPRIGLHVRQETLDRSDITTVDGLTITTAVRTSFDCARWLWGVERVVVVDALAHANLASIAEVQSYADSKRALRNLRRAREVLAVADAGAESAMETRVRVTLSVAGFVAVTQFIVYDHAGVFVARLDLAFPEAKLAVEYDGSFHFEQRREDDRRRDRLRALGWTVLVYSAKDYYERRHVICLEVAAHLRRRTRQPPPSSATKQAV